MWTVRDKPRLSSYNLLPLVTLKMRMTVPLIEDVARRELSREKVMLANFELCALNMDLADCKRNAKVNISLSGVVNSE